MGVCQTGNFVKLIDSQLVGLIDTQISGLEGIQLSVLKHGTNLSYKNDSNKYGWLRNFDFKSLKDRQKSRKILIPINRSISCQIRILWPFLGLIFFSPTIYVWQKWHQIRTCSFSSLGVSWVSALGVSETVTSVICFDNSSTIGSSY